MEFYIMMNPPLPIGKLFGGVGVENFPNSAGKGTFNAPNTWPQAESELRRRRGGTARAIAGHFGSFTSLAGVVPTFLLRRIQCLLLSQQ